MACRISVITSVFNRAATIEDALRSVHGQVGPAIEHVVIEAGSTDGSRSIVERYRSRIDTLICEPDDGIYHGLNKGIAAATGDVVGFMHADDMFADAHALERVAAAFEDPDVHAVYGDLEYVDKDRPERVVRYWRAGAFDRALLGHGWMPPHPTFYVRRDVYQRLGAFRTSYKIAADYENMLRVLGSPDVNVQYIPGVMVRMRTGGVSNNSLRNLIRKAWEDYSAMRQNGQGGLHALLLKNLTKLPQFVVREPARLAIPVEASSPGAPRI